jgi:DNA polymerase-3 subunit delta'
MPPESTTPVEAPRPRANPDLIGQELAETAFQSSWRSGRMPHAWLLAGPRGIGKATFAYRAARYVLAGGEAGGLFAGPALSNSLALPSDHPAFRRVAAGGHADLLTVERKVNPKTDKLRDEIVVDDVRDVGEFLHLTPGEGGWRVVIVDAAEEMNINAANAVLKVLEEPPRQALLLLVTHAPGRLLPTIRSRCRLLNLAPLADTQVDGLLARYRPELEPGDRSVLVTLGEGSIGRAIDLADRGGVELYKEMLALLERLPALDIPAVHDFADRLGRGSEAAAGFRTAMELLQGWLSRVIKAARTGGGGPGGSLDRWIGVWDKIGRLAVRTESVNLDRKLVLVSAFVALAAAADERSRSPGFAATS